MIFSLPLQPVDGWWRQPSIRTVLALSAFAVGLAVLGWVGLTRRMPSELLITAPGEPYAYPRAAERLIAGAQSRVWLLQYVIRPDDGDVVDGLLTALAAARQRGVEVRVALDRGLLYGTTDRDPKNDAAAAWFAAHDIPVVWDEENRTSHAKVLLVDDRVAIIGSHNWTRAALTGNREVSVLLTDPLQVARIRELVQGIPGWSTPVAPGTATSRH